MRKRYGRLEELSPKNQSYTRTTRLRRPPQAAGRRAPSVLLETILLRLDLPNC